MKKIFALLFVANALVFMGCDAKSGAVPKNAAGPNHIPVVTQLEAGDPAKYVFHRNVAFTEVTRGMSDGSVDHIDLNMAADPNVVVVVTVSAAHKDGLRFTTTFTGSNDLKIIKEWGPASGSNEKGQHVGLFVLPATVNAGSTTVH